MALDICSIPVEEIFGEGEGCPICRMRDMLDERAVEYITGAAMMEPDVRKVTNQKGFCFRHYKQMLSRHARLQVALTMQSHLDEIDKKIMSGLLSSASGKAGKTEKLTESCFICDEVERGMKALINNTIDHFVDDREFRKLFCSQDYICLPHYSRLINAAEKTCPKKYRGDFNKEATRLTREDLSSLRGDVKHFCDMFDYRNQTEEADWGNSRDALERAVAYLTSDNPEKK